MLSPMVTAESITSPPPKNVIIKSADMKDELQKEAVNIAISAFENNSVEKDVAEHIKKEFDKRHGPTWHCIVGRNFERAANQWRCNQRHHRDQELEKQNPWLGSASSLAYQFL
ncbi:hypothetical protein V6N13_023623 [Hibiscus sabdariffa]|uniref:Dynein light chain n=2 Tax=Hibiscus sabdariffa TaxID=183260 RepID=A0ABR1ZRN2_9ROSI